MFLIASQQKLEYLKHVVAVLEDKPLVPKETVFSVAFLQDQKHAKTALKKVVKLNYSIAQDLE